MAFTDKFIAEVDAVLRTLLPQTPRANTRPSPADQHPPAALTPSEKKHVAGLVRVNHAGEVCAQALYQGQALTARLTHIKEQMHQAATEETDHLAWCEQRLNELHAKPSVFNTLWYGGSFILGACAGLAGDAISLGFVAETERQVTLHLQKHVQDLPPTDTKTKAVLEHMQQDEAQHAQVAINAGAVTLPYAVQQAMALVSKLMTRSSYFI